MNIDAAIRAEQVLGIHHQRHGRNGAETVNNFVAICRIVDHVLIHSLNDSVFLASIHLVGSGGASCEVDSRPSDAIAIALRSDADVLVDQAVLERALVAESSQDETIRAILERLRPEDMGEYEM